MEYLSRQEEMVLLAVHHLGEDASLVSVRRYLNKHTEKRWSMSSVYIPLDRLKKSGHLDSTIGEPTPRRGGRAKKTLESVIDLYFISTQLESDLGKIFNYNEEYLAEKIRDIRSRIESVLEYESAPC